MCHKWFNKSKKIIKNKAYFKKIILFFYWHFDLYINIIASYLIKKWFTRKQAPMTKKSISRSYSKILQFLKFKDQIVTKINQLGRVISVFQMHSYVLSTDFNDLKFNTIVKIAFDAEDLCILILSKFLKDLEDLLDSLKTLNKNLKLFLLSFFYFFFYRTFF